MLITSNGVKSEGDVQRRVAVRDVHGRTQVLGRQSRDFPMDDLPLSSVDLSWNLAKEEVLIDNMNQRNLSVPFTWHKKLKDGPVETEEVMLDDVVVYGPVAVGGVLVLGIVVGC